MKNTLLSYMYRDANNYKVGRTVILEGELSPKQIQDIRNKIGSDEDDNGFVPHQVGLDDLQAELQAFDSKDWDDDLSAHELTELEPTGYAFPNGTMTAQELYDNFMKVDKWEFDATVPHILNEHGYGDEDDEDDL